MDGVEPFLSPLSIRSGSIPLPSRGDRGKDVGVNLVFTKGGGPRGGEVQGGAGAMATLATQMQRLTLGSNGTHAVGCRVHVAGTRLGGAPGGKNGRNARVAREGEGGGRGPTEEKEGSKPTTDASAMRADGRNVGPRTRKIPGAKGETRETGARMETVRRGRIRSTWADATPARERTCSGLGVQTRGVR
eukprot:scaffold109_cov368-Pavlova_lutheri.AAC.16